MKSRLLILVLFFPILLLLAGNLIFSNHEKIGKYSPLVLLIHKDIRDLPVIDKSLDTNFRYVFAENTAPGIDGVVLKFEKPENVLNEIDGYILSLGFSKKSSTIYTKNGIDIEIKMDGDLVIINRYEWIS